MKKKAMLGLALACAMCFTVSLAACGNNDAVVPDTTKVTEEVWQTQAAAFAEATNFTLDRVSVETGKSVGMMKLDGAVYGCFRAMGKGRDQSIRLRRPH